MPIYNKKDEFQFTLASIQNQSYDFNKFELVLIDDGSTDGLRRSISEKNLPFTLKHITFPQNKGRSIARNAGIRAAEGDIIILADADCILPKDYISNHAKYHHQNKMIVSGEADYHPIYTFFYSQLSTSDKSKIKRILTNNPSIYARVKQTKRHPNNKFPIADLKDIQQGQFSKYSIRDWKGLFHDIREEYGEELKDFNGRWMAFTTRNVSIQREELLKVGLFDENFIKYGLEDWELGYRLYKAGCNFICPSDVYNFHQEHPRNSRSQLYESILNYRMFRDKHDNLELYLYSLSLGDWNNWHIANIGKLYTELEILERSDMPDKERLLKLLEELSYIYSNLLIKNANQFISEKLYEEVKKLVNIQWQREKYMEALQTITNFQKSSEKNSFPFINKVLNLLLA